MGSIKANVAGKEDLIWPPLCVLCLKPNPEEKYEASCGEVGWSIPYCRDCYARVTRFQNWGEGLALALASWTGFTAGALFLVDKIRDEGWGVLLCLDGDVWGMAMLAAIMAGLAIWFSISLAVAVIRPHLPALFPGKFSRAGVSVNTNVSEAGAVVMEEIEFSNFEYAKKFCRANGFDKSHIEGEQALREDTSDC